MNHKIAFIIAGFAVMAPAVAQAQAAPGQTVAPQGASAIETSGVIAHYVPGPFGHVRGLLLDNGTVVMLNHDGDAVSQQAPIGTQVTVRGVAHPAHPNVIHGATVTGPNGVLHQAAAPGAGWQGHAGGWRHGAGATPGQFGNRFGAALAQLPVVSHHGAVLAVMGGARRGIHMAVLNDGTAVYFHGTLAAAVATHGLAAGDSIDVTGNGNTYATGIALAATSVTFGDGQTAQATP